jgi:cell wall-associated NlpC family hydrolase
VKRSTFLIAVGVVLAVSPVVLAGATAIGLTVMSAAIVPAPCATAGAGTAACTDEALPALDPAREVAVPNIADGVGGQAALAAVTAVGRGGRYVAEGNGPVDFDCSGLTAWAWRQVGVSLPDYSYSQWDITARISREQLQPGDLVFWFGGDVHHVAIVVTVDAGRVRIAEAANPGAGLRVRDLGDSWDQAYLSGYGRVIHT